MVELPTRVDVGNALEEVGTFPPNPEEVVVWAWVLPVLEAYRDGRLVEPEEPFCCRDDDVHR